jgi:UDP-2,3-diacylglucosamine hydrolase
VPGHSLFVADLHLADERLPATEAFVHFLRNTARDADALYILGDLFEYWVGDDDRSGITVDLVARELSALRAAGTAVYFLHGNRDFLLARDYAQRAGMTLIADPCVIELYSEQTALLHGDTLCTDDLDYQRLRQRIRKPWVMRALRALPLSLRHRLAIRARRGSARAKAGKSATIMDVNPNAVESCLQSLGVKRLIHGHTHRPGHHRHTRGERWVLPDWYAEGGYLRCDASGCALFQLGPASGGAISR